MRAQLEGLRFSYEKELLEQVKRSLGPERVNKREAVRREQFHARKRSLLGDAVRITEDLLPDVHRRYMECLALLGGDLKGDLYVQQSPEYNASVFAMGDRFDIMVHSSLLRDFTLDELTFVMGHELGHVLFDHSSFSIHEVFREENGVDSNTAQSMLAWSRAAEVSADRIGLVCCGTLSGATSALFKTSSGIPGIDQTRILASLRSQYDELVAHIDDEGEGHEWVRTHPMVPIRFKAIELGALDLVMLRKNASMFSARGFRGIDKQIANILRKLDERSGPGMGSSRPLANPNQQAAALIALVYVALCDGSLSATERTVLTDVHMKLSCPFPLSDILDSAVKNRLDFVSGAPGELKRRSDRLHPDDVELVVRLAVAMCLQCSRKVDGAEKVALQTLSHSLKFNGLDTVIKEYRENPPGRIQRVFRH